MGRGVEAIAGRVGALHVSMKTLASSRTLARLPSGRGECGRKESGFHQRERSRAGRDPLLDIEHHVSRTAIPTGLSL